MLFKERDEKNFFDFILWVYILGGCQADITNCRKNLEDWLNAQPDPDDKEKYGVIWEVFHKLQFLEHQMNY